MLKRVAQFWAFVGLQLLSILVAIVVWRGGLTRRGDPMQLLIAVDQTGNAIAWGSPDEMMSAAAWRKQLHALATQGNLERWCWAVRIINALFRDPDHCRKAFLTELQRQQLPAAYRSTL